jgi:hypothetical protein
MIAVYIAGVQMDISESAAVPIEKSLSDIQNPKNRKVSHSKTLTFPGTPNNNRLFRQLFITNKDNSVMGFDPNVRQPAFIQSDSAMLLSGFFQLLKVINDVSVVSYEGVIYADEKDLFSQMGDSFLVGNSDPTRDVDLETGTTENRLQFDSTHYSLSTANNFTTNNNEAYLVPMELGYNLYDGTTFPFNDLSHKSFRLAVRFLHIWNRIFDKYNLRYTSTFVRGNTEDEFRRYVYLDTHALVMKTDAQIEEALSIYGSSGTQGYLSGENNLIYDELIEDSNSNYNTVGLTGEYIAPQTDVYRASLVLKLKRKLVFNQNITISQPTIVTIQDTLTARVNNVGFFSRSINKRVTISVGVYNTNDEITFTYSATRDLLFYNAGELGTDEVSLQQNDVLDIRFNSVSNNAVVDAEWELDEGSTIKIEYYDKALTVGNVYSKNSVPATQHKQVDFIVDVIRMFNLYLLWDGTQYIVEPRDKFYTLGSERDYTSFVDRSKPIEIVPVGQLNWKELKFIPALDDDFYSQKYNSDFGENYGQQNVINDNEFVRQTSQIPLTFVAPMTVQDAADRLATHHIYKIGSNGLKDPISGKPRYGVWNGWQNFGITYKIDSDSNVSYSGYPFAGEFYDFGGNRSGLFGTPRQIYYTPIDAIFTVPGSTLVTRHYLNDLQNQIDLNAKVVTYTMLLTALEINNLQLYDTIVIDGVRYIISNISIPNANSYIACELKLIQFIQ